MVKERGEDKDAGCRGEWVERKVEAISNQQSKL